jgi:hypothetical protein
MLMMVQFEAFETIVGERAIASLRSGVGKQIEVISKSGKLKGGAIFASKRGGFLLLEVADGNEIIELLGAPIIDHFHIETMALISFEQLGQFFQKHPIHSHA